MVLFPAKTQTGNEIPAAVVPAFEYIGRLLFLEQDAQIGPHRVSHKRGKVVKVGLPGKIGGLQIAVVSRAVAHVIEMPQVRQTADRLHVFGVLGGIIGVLHVGLALLRGGTGRLSLHHRHNIPGRDGWIGLKNAHAPVLIHQLVKDQCKFVFINVIGQKMGK